MTKNLPTKLGSGHRSGNLKTEKKSQVATATSPPLSENNNVSSSIQKPSVVAKMLTPEQRRLANLMNDKVDVLDIEKKINKIMELTGASKDKAIVALHDCANELDKAIDMILEGDSINESEWKSQARKKKPKAVLANNKDDNKMHVNGDKKKLNKNRNNKQGKPGTEKPVQNQSKDRSNKRDHWKAKESDDLSPKEYSDDKLESWDENVKKPHDQFKPIKYRSSQDRKDKTAGNNKGSYNRNNERYGQGGDKNSSGSRGPKNYQNKNYKNSGFPNSIDTWTNITAGTNSNSNNNDYAQMTVGIWSEVDAHGELEENFKSKPKFPSDNIMISTYEHKNPNLASIVSGVKPHQSLQNAQAKPNQHNNQQKSNTSDLDHHGSKHGSQNQQMPPNTLQKTQSSQPQRQPNQHQAQQSKIDLATLLKTSQPNSQNLPEQQMNKLIRGNMQRNDSNTYGAALLHRLQQRVQEMGSEAGKSNLNEYVNQYSSQPQDNIKNLVNIPSNNFNSQNPLLLDNQPPQGQTQNLNQQHQIDQKSNKNRITQKRQTKIPETAVEMPNSDHISSLNVQFGALDFGTENYLNNENNSTNYHEQINNKQSKNLVQNQVNNNLDNATLLSTVRDANYRNNQSVDKQQQPGAASKDILQNMDQQLSENILERNKQPTSYNKASIYNQQHSENIGSYKNTYGNQNESHIYPANYNSQNANYGYVSSNTSQSNNYSVNNYSSNYGNNSTQNHNSHSNTNTSSSSNGNPAQKINLKDLDTSTTGNTNSTNINTTSSSLGLVSNTTVTTNVLKNSLTATGKNNMQQPNVAAPNVAPLLGTPQYIMSQPGLSAFYPIYDVPMAGPGREHNFGYNPNTQDVKYSRAEANDANNVQSTQAPVTQTPNHQIFSQFPPHYGFFYTGVNMMTQGLYQTAAPFLPVQPPNPGPPSGSTSNSTGFPKGQNQGAYGSHSAYSSAYDPLSAATQLQNQQDYNKQNYSGPNSANQQQSQQQQSGKQISSGGSNELGSSNMYTKTHAQLTKNYDKPNFQTGTPPPFGIVNAAAALGYNPSQYIPMLQPQSNPSMLHHTLQGDGNQNVSSSGVGGSQRNQPQKNSNAKSFYANWA